MNFILGLRQLPFEQEQDQIIYVESQYDEIVNRYIQDNYNQILKLFSEKGYKFCYIPALVKELSKSSTLQFYAPELENDFVPNKDIHSDLLLDWMVNPEKRDKIKPSLLYYHPKAFNHEYEDMICQFRGITLTPDTGYDKTNDLSVILDQILRSLNYYDSHDSGIRFMKGEDEDEDIDPESLSILMQAREKIEMVEQRGYSRAVINRLINRKPKLSRILITKDYRILLPDYKNKEIILDDLPKALFLLYLKYSEGIAFASLKNYKEELTKIYAYIKGKSDAVEVNETRINNLIKPKSTTINPNRTRVNTAFMEAFDSHLSDYYIIQGEKKMPYKIMIDRNLVEWEDEKILLIPAPKGE